MYATETHAPLHKNACPRAFIAASFVESRDENKSNTLKEVYLGKLWNAHTVLLGSRYRGIPSADKKISRTYGYMVT